MSRPVTPFTAVLLLRSQRARDHQAADEPAPGAKKRFVFSPPFLVLPPEARVFLRQEEAIPSNYYPISASAFIRDEAATAGSGAQARQLTLLTDRGHGESCRSPVLPLPFLHFLDPPSHCASTAVLR